MKDRLSNYGPFSVYVINTLNIISILLPTAVWFKGSFVSWQSAQGAAQEKAVPVLPRADWSQEGTALCNSTEDKAESPTLVDHAFSLSLSLSFFFSLHPTHQIFKWNFNGFLSHKHTIVLFLLFFLSQVLSSDLMAAFVYCHHHVWFAAIALEASSDRITSIERDRGSKEKH